MRWLNPETGERESVKGSIPDRRWKVSLLALCVCVRTSPQGYPILQKIMIKILQDHICPLSLPIFFQCLT